MTDKEYNLLDESWILVMTPDNKVKSIGISEIFSKAHEIKSLAGENKTQDVAILRMLLAILYTVYLRHDQNGNPSEVCEQSDAIERWTSIWNDGKFNGELIDRHLRKNKDGFYLFHPTRPFAQSPIESGTKYKTSKINGLLIKSGNKERFFATISGEDMDSLSYAEAARWILHVNGFDDLAPTHHRCKSEGREKAKGKIGYLGELGIVTVRGRNLFETLMLNFVMVDRDGDPIKDSLAPWEKEVLDTVEKREIPVPESLIDLYTVQSRRILLKRDGDRVIGAEVIIGDVFDTTNALLEPMTLWNTYKDGSVRPHQHKPEVYFWRDFAPLMAKIENRFRPGIVEWCELIEEEQSVDLDNISFETCGLFYKSDANRTIIDSLSDSLTMNASLLSELGESWSIRISDAIERTSKAVWAYGVLVSDLINMKRVRDDEKKKKKLRSLVKKKSENECALAFYNIDPIFRQWLFSISPNSDDMDESVKNYLECVLKLILEMGKMELDSIDDSTFVGTTMDSNALSSYSLFQNIVYKTLRV